MRKIMKMTIKLLKLYAKVVVPEGVSKASGKR